MLKTKKKLPIWAKVSIVILALILILAATAAVAYRRYIYPTGEIMPGLYAVRTHRNGMPMGNFFLMRAGEKYIAFDAGADNTENENGLKRLGISAEDVVAVFITHYHWDHIASIGLFENAVIYTGNTENSGFPDIPHRIMSDGEIIEFYGVSVQCFYTPGHTADSVCYVVSGKYLFVGDLLVTTNDPPPPNPRRYDAELQLHHREKMLGLDGVEYVFTGHFGLFKSVRFFRWRWL